MTEWQGYMIMVLMCIMGLDIVKNKLTRFYLFVVGLFAVISSFFAR